MHLFVHYTWSFYKFPFQKQAPKYKNKLVPVHNMKTWGAGGIAPSILNLDT